MPSANSEAETPALSTASVLDTLPKLLVKATLPIRNVVALAPAAGAAWFITTGSPGTVGLLAPSGVARARPAGPAPVAVVGAGQDIFVVEGSPDSGETSEARTNVLERIDAASLNVVGRVSLTESTTAVAHTSGLVWTMSTQGTVTAYEDQALVPRWTGHVKGIGSASISAGSNEVWGAIGSVGESGDGHYVVAQIDLPDGHAMRTTVVPGDGVAPMIAAGTGTWLAIADYPIFDRLYRLNANGVVGTPTYIPSPAGMASAAGRLWWVSASGSVGAVDEKTGAASPEIRLPGGSGVAIAVDNSTAYAAVGDHVFVLVPAPLAAP